MSNLPQSDRILAGRFVDGDLSAQEAAEAKSRIASDSAFAAAVEEIRSQSGLLNGLPVFKPSEDLADRTLQASLDQVKAIMGAWPIESADSTVTPASHSSSESFDWKSAAALVSALAGCLLIGSMLWQGNNSSEPGIAMGKAPVSAAPMEQNVDRSVASKSAFRDEESGLDDETFSTQEKGSASIVGKGSGLKEKASIDTNAIEDVLSKSVPQVAISGTPMSVPSKQTFDTAKQSRMPLNSLNASAPVDQIWYVNQDRSCSRAAVCDILNSNSIQVQSDEVAQKPNTAITTNDVDAFYVAATPKQMKLAMSQISNNADIEMIQLPSNESSLIADAIEQQYSQRKPPRFAKPESQALAQQLVSNFLPRNRFVPNGPIPPILKSGAPIQGLSDQALEDAAKKDLASKSTEPVQPKVSRSKAARNVGGGGAGAGGGGFGGIMPSENNVANNELPAQQQAEQVQAAMQTPQEGELGKFLDESDEQLRQYLILVRGGEEEKEEAPESQQ